MKNSKNHTISHFIYISYGSLFTSQSSMANCKRKWKFFLCQHIMIMLMKFSAFIANGGFIFMSSGKRRDKKNRVLHSGEIQLSNGRYRYKYVNFDGKENYVYSWRLVDTDPTPSGKRKGLSLRELEEKIQHDLDSGCAALGNKITVLELVEDYVAFKKNTVRKTTQAGYMTVINILKKDSFGAKRIDTVTVFEAKNGLQNYRLKRIEVIAQLLRLEVF